MWNYQSLWLPGRRPLEVLVSVLQDYPTRCWSIFSYCNGHENSMAKRLRPCGGISGMLLLLSFITFSFGAVSRGQAQTGSPPPQALIIHPYGVVGVKTLPTPAPRTRVPQVVPHRVPDPEAL